MAPITNNEDTLNGTNYHDNNEDTLNGTNYHQLPMKIR